MVYVYTHQNLYMNVTSQSVIEMVVTSGEGPGNQGGRDTYGSLYVF